MRARMPLRKCLVNPPCMIETCKRPHALPLHLYSVQRKFHPVADLTLLVEKGSV